MYNLSVFSKFKNSNKTFYHMTNFFPCQSRLYVKSSTLLNSWLVWLLCVLCSTKNALWCLNSFLARWMKLITLIAKLFICSHGKKVWTYEMELCRKVGNCNGCKDCLTSEASTKITKNDFTNVCIPLGLIIVSQFHCMFQWLMFHFVDFFLISSHISISWPCEHCINIKA